jgi:fatty-acyl-CoA synthase
MNSAYVSGPSAVPLLGETIGQCLDRIAAAHPDREALVSVHQGLRFTYRQLRAEAERVAKGLIALGVARGDRVGIWGPNSAEWLITQHAAAKAGAILVNVNPAYRLRELEYALQQSGVSLLIAATRFRQTSYVEMLDEVSPRVPELRTIVYSSRVQKDPAYASPDQSDVGRVLSDPARTGKTILAWEDLQAAASGVTDADLRERESALQFDDAVNIQYTSGTTGAPKGATLSHHNILNNGYFVGQTLRYTPEDRICVPVPFYHCFGCVMANLAAVTHACTVVLPAETFEPEACLRAIEAERCTSLYGVPTMFIAQLSHPSFAKYRLDSLRTGIMAGAPCPVEVMRQVLDRMHMSEVTICYGMTETSPVSFQSGTNDLIEHRVSTVGSIHPHAECKVIDPETGRVVARGERGELCTRGYLVMLGYWNDPDATRAVLDEARWMHTGDLAVMRDDGYVNIVGRLKDMIIRGGENIYPRELEEFLYTHPKVSEVQVIGVPDVKYGEAVCAWIRLREGQDATQDEIRKFCEGQIATFKIPRYIRFTSEFPMTVTGKIQKFKMREISVAELGLGTAEAVKTA